MIIINEKESLDVLRKKREEICFPIINRGKLRYDSLSSEQYQELKDWYKKWLNVTETNIIPETPKWLNDKIVMEDIILW